MRFGIIAILLTMVLPLSADEFNLESLYAEIDASIEHSPKYVAAHESKIREAKDVLTREWSTEKRLYQLMHIYELYRAFDNDSALHYICLSRKDKGSFSVLYGGTLYREYWFAEVDRQ